jgi:multidrug efflux pump subunit AcrA (membrane-fusion protein)
MRKLELAKTRADAALAVAEKALAAAKTDQAKARGEDQKQKAAAKVEDLQTQLDAAKANAKSKLDAAAAAQDAAKAAETKKADAAKAASDAKLALEPVSVFISRATQKLYVRRNTHKPAPDGGGEVFDASIEVPVAIRNPEKRIGTHVFTAMARGDAGLRWTAVTIDDADDAKDALDRITIPQDVLDRIGPTALPRSSIVVSDEPLSAETNYRTEFVAVLSNQPQGGFITREPSSDTFVAGDGFRSDDGFGFFFQRGWGPRWRGYR